MKTNRLYFLFILIGFLANCSDEEFEAPLDTQGPEILDIRWIDSPFYDKDIGGPIQDGETYTISISDGFQISFRILDESLISTGEGYFLINDDPSLKKYLFGPNNIFNYKDGSIGSIQRHRKLSLGDGEFYTIQPNDTYHFYLSFIDEHGNTTRMQWMTDLIE